MITILCDSTMISDIVDSAASTIPNGMEFTINTSILSDISDVATVAIALINIVLLFLFERWHRKDNGENQEANRRISLMNTLVLDHNMKYFYSSYDKLRKDVEYLKEKDCLKKEVERNVQESLKTLNQNFIYFIMAIDVTMHNKLMEISDNCRDLLVANISDEGINLDVEKMFNEKIKKVIDECERKMLSLLFNYDGKS